MHKFIYDTPHVPCVNLSTLLYSRVVIRYDTVFMGREIIAFLPTTRLCCLTGLYSIMVTLSHFFSSADTGAKFSRTWLSKYIGFSPFEKYIKHCNNSIQNGLRLLEMKMLLCFVMSRNLNYFYMIGVI